MAKLIEITMNQPKFLQSDALGIGRPLLRRGHDSTPYHRPYMKKLCHPKWKTASLGLAATLALTGSATAGLVIVPTSETGAENVYPFTPSWTPSATSLIAGVVPVTTANGNFNTESTEATVRNVNSLTAGGSLVIAPMPLGGGSTTTNNYAACGQNAGLSATYALPASALGYEVTNITVYSGWKDSGRDGQAYNVSYSTLANPTVFHLLAIVNNSGPTLPANTPSALRVSLADSAGAAIAHNVAYIRFDFSAPDSENGWTGYGAITVNGTAATATAPEGILPVAENKSVSGDFQPDWVLESNNLIKDMLPGTISGNFLAENSAGPIALTDSLLGFVADHSGFATAGPGAGNMLIYTLTNSVNGSDLTNITLYSGWGDRNREGQGYVIYYSTVSAPTTFLPLVTNLYNPDISSTLASANRVMFHKADGTAFAQNVHSLKFDFAALPSFDYGYSGYSEIIVQGTDSQPPVAPPSPYMVQDTLPSRVLDVEGAQVVFSVAFSNAPPVSYQWQVIKDGTTNDVTGATSSTLTLNNVKVTDAGAYRVKAINATNSLGVSYSTASTLIISNVPAAVDGVIISYASQTGLGSSIADTNFYPTWTIAGNSMIGGAIPVPGTGDYGLGGSGGDPAILTDGTFGYLNYWPNVGVSPTLVTCGVPPAGLSVIYNFDTTSAVNGFDLTNIVVYGGWGDAGRDAQKFQVLYSTVADPSTFNQLATVDFNPSNPNNWQTASRSTLTPSGSALVQNVAAVMFNFGLAGGPVENGYAGYSEIVVGGKPSAPKPVLSQDIRPLTAKDVVGSKVEITAGFTSSSPVTYQWRKDGVNIPGANTPTLTLSNLKLSDTATNGGYSLVASNSSGYAVSRGCALTVTEVPQATNNVIASIAYQTGDSASFSPTWSVIPGSMISGLQPSATGTGNFNDPDGNPNAGGQAGGLPVLTDDSYGMLVTGGPHPAFATCGPNAGRYVIYNLGEAANGYDLTNIVISGGWNDSGRDHQAYTIGYATRANPTTFMTIAVMNNNPVLAVNANHSLVRSTFTPVNGVLASNVIAVMVDFVTPPGENAYSGYSEISLYGRQSTSVPAPGPVVSVENQNTDAPTWVVETGNLIAGKLPDVVGAGNFQAESSGGLPVLTDGVVGPLAGKASFATAGSGAGRSVTYFAPYGWNLSQIVVYSGWGDAGRDGQFYNVSYSTLSDPATFRPLVSVDYNPDVASGASVNRVSITNSTGGLLAAGVAAVKFDFARQIAQDNTYSGYAELVLLGTTPPHLGAFAVSGNDFVLTGGGTPGDTYSILVSTNVAAPLSEWKTNTVGTVDSSGAWSNAIPLSTGEPKRFFRLKMP